MGAVWQRHAMCESAFSCPAGHYIVSALHQAQQENRITEDEINEACGLVGKHGIRIRYESRKHKN